MFSGEWNLKSTESLVEDIRLAISFYHQRCKYLSMYWRRWYWTRRDSVWEVPIEVQKDLSKLGVIPESRLAPSKRAEKQNSSEWRWFFRTWWTLNFCSGDSFTLIQYIQYFHLRCLQVSDPFLLIQSNKKKLQHNVHSLLSCLNPETAKANFDAKNAKMYLGLNDTE